MRGSQKSKGVTWASNEYLCQVKLFLSEESPSQVASSAQDHLQAKAAWDLVSNGSVSDENLPPGFEGPQPTTYALMSNASQIPLIKWKFPPKYVINGSWRVVAGDESDEVKTQSKREMSILEAIYPRSIPSDPEFGDAEEVSYQDDEQQCPLIPITPMEDEDVTPEIQNNLTSSSATSSSFDPNFLAAAQSALSTLMKNNNQANNTIDSELLIKVLSDPKLIEQLVRNQGMNLHLPHVTGPELAAAPSPHSGGFYSLPLNAPPLPLPPPPPPPPPPMAPVTKDVNYYKSLIQQHGEERLDSMNSGGVVHSNNQQYGFRQRDLKQKIMKPCMYFNTSRGCRNGANCTYQHEGSSSKQRINNSNQDSQNANKRMKLEREITGI